jgi:hypothetical protein
MQRLLTARFSGGRLPSIGLVLGLAIVVLAAQPASAQLTFTMPQNLTETPGGTVTVPVSLTNTTGSAIQVEDFQFAIRYDATGLTTPFTISNIGFGSGDPTFTFTPTFPVLNNPGVALISAADYTTFTGFSIPAYSTVSILTFNLTSTANAPLGSNVINLMNTFTNANGSFTYEVDDPNGNPITVSPPPVNYDYSAGGAPGTSDGVVTIVSAVPEPGTIVLFGQAIVLGGLRFAWVRRRRLKNAG